MKIYFAASLTNRILEINFYKKIVTYLENYGKIVNPHIANYDKLEKGNYSAKEKHDYDIKKLEEADVVIAEITAPSLGVGYEIGRMIKSGKPILGIYNLEKTKKVSPMFSGSEKIEICSYENFNDLKKKLKLFFNKC